MIDQLPQRRLTANQKRQIGRYLVPSADLSQLERLLIIFHKIDGMPIAAIADSLNMTKRRVVELLESIQTRVDRADAQYERDLKIARRDIANRRRSLAQKRKRNGSQRPNA